MALGVNSHLKVKGLHTKKRGRGKVMKSIAQLPPPHICCTGRGTALRDGEKGPMGTLKDRGGRHAREGGGEGKMVFQTA